MGMAAGMVAFDVYWQLGSAQPVQGDTPLLMDTARHYLLAAVKDRSTVSVSAVDLDARAFAKLSVMAPNAQAVDPGGEARVRLANVDCELNGGSGSGSGNGSGNGRWDANLLAVLMYPWALTDGDLLALYAYFHDALRAFDPEYQQMQRLQAEVRRSAACPYDAATCDACRSVNSEGQDGETSASVGAWSTASLVARASPECLAAVDRFCASNPQHAQCACWDASSPQYATPACVAFRAAFSGAAVPSQCADVEGERAASTPGQVVSDILSPANVDAFTRILGAMRQAAPDSESDSDSDSDSSDSDSDSDAGFCGRNPRHERCDRSPDPRDDDREADGDGDAPRMGFWRSLFG